MVQFVSLPTNAAPTPEHGMWVHIYQRRDGKFLVEVGEPEQSIRYATDLATFVVARARAKVFADQLGIETIHVMGC